MSLKVLLELKAKLQQEAQEIQASIEPALAIVREQVANADKAIHELVIADLTSIRKLQGKEFGGVHVTKDGYRVTETISKKILPCASSSSNWTLQKLISLTIRQSCWSQNI